MLFASRVVTISARVKKSLRTTVPVHGNEALRIGTLLGILRDIEMSPHDFREHFG